MCAKSIQSCPTLRTAMDCSPQALLSMGFSRQEYWSGLPYPPPEDLPDPGTEPVSLMSPALVGELLTVWATQEWQLWHYRLDGHKFEQAPGVGDGQEAWRVAVHGVTKSRTRLSDWTELMILNKKEQIIATPLLPRTLQSKKGKKTSAQTSETKTSRKKRDYLHHPQVSPHDLSTIQKKR